MDPKEYLNQIRFVNQDIETRVDERNKLRDSIAIKTSTLSMDKVQESGTINFDDNSDYVRHLEEQLSIANQKVDEHHNVTESALNEAREISGGTE